MEGIGKRRSRGLLLKDGIGREGNGKGEEGRGGRRKGGEQPVLTVKNGSRAPGQ